MKDLTGDKSVVQEEQSRLGHLFCRTETAQRDARKEEGGEGFAHVGGNGTRREEIHPHVPGGEFSRPGARQTQKRSLARCIAGESCPSPLAHNAAHVEDAAPRTQEGLEETLRHVHGAAHVDAPLRCQIGGTETTQRGRVATAGSVDENVKVRTLQEEREEREFMSRA